MASNDDDSTEMMTLSSDQYHPKKRKSSKGHSVSINPVGTVIHNSATIKPQKDSVRKICGVKACPGHVMCIHSDVHTHIELLLIIKHLCITVT